MIKPFLSVGLLSGAMLCVSMGYAASPSRPPLTHGIPRSDIDTIPLSTITTDTGAFAMGNKEFSRFTTPGLCLAAVEVASTAARRTMVAQTAHVFEATTMGGEALPANVVAVARGCGTRFTVSRTAPAHLFDLLTLALLAGHDSTASAVVERLVTMTASVDGRAEVLQRVIQTYLAASPVRWAAAEAAATRLDALGPAVQWARLNAHETLLKHAMRRFDANYIRREANSIIMLGRDVSPQALGHQPQNEWNGRRDGPIIWAYAALGRLAYVEQPDSVLAIMTRAKHDLSRFGGGRNHSDQDRDVNMLALNYTTASVVTIRNAMIPFTADYFVGKPLPPISASYWVPAPLETWPPRRPTLILYSGRYAIDCPRNDAHIFAFARPEGAERGGCGLLYSYFPKWVKQYGNRLSIAIVSPSRERAARSIKLSPRQEADSLAWFFRDHLKLPVTVGLVLDSVWRLSPIDGREFRRDTSFYGNLPGKSAGSSAAPDQLVVMFYGAQGMLRYIGQLDLPVLQRLIDKEMESGSPVSRPRATL